MKDIVKIVLFLIGLALLAPYNENPVEFLPKNLPPNVQPYL